MRRLFAAAVVLSHYSPNKLTPRMLLASSLVLGGSAGYQACLGQESAATPTPEAVAASPVAASPVATSEDQVSLSFRQQPWLPALQWLASELKLNLDWQTLPDGEFSLHSERTYSLEEAEDMMNMQLLARGYTLLQREEVLRVVPLKDVDITLVPRVNPEELESLPRHKFVRVSFPLEWMIAEEAAQEFAPLLSPFGKLSPMRSTNRLEVMDAVINLREMYRLLVKAEANDGRRERVAEFPLKHRKAEEIAIKVRQLLGLPPDTTSSTTQTQLDIEQARFKAEAVKQMGSEAKELIKEKRPDVFLTINDKENSLLVNAPPNKMEIVRQAVEALDRPLPERESMWATVSKVKVHEVEGFDPTAVTALLTSLQTNGNIAKDARVQYEAAYNRIIVFASPEDQLTIGSLIESFRAKRRSAVVLPLGNMQADYAVKAVQLILKNPQRPPTAPGVASDGQFQIEADPDHGRLLLWATPDEVTEVQEFLTTLDDSRFADRVKSEGNMQVVTLNGAQLDKLLPRFKAMWEQLSDQPVVMDAEIPAASSDPQSVPQSKSTEPTLTEPTEAPSRDTKVEPASTAPNRGAMQSNNNSIHLVSHALVSEESTDQTTPKQAANPNQASSSQANPSQANTESRATTPLRFVQGEDGELIILSKDPQAAQAARSLIEKMLPQPSALTTIVLKHAQAIYVRRQIEELLELEQPVVASKLATPREPLRIDVDMRTNRLVLQNGSEGELKKIKELVEVLDQPVAVNDRLSRQQKIYRFKNRKAEDVVEIVKDVYRDLLSVNDRSFSTYSGRGPVGYNQNLAATQSNPEYQGLLSVAADTEANLLVISAPGYLIEDVTKLVESVDSAKDGTTLTVTTFATDPKKDEEVRDALSRILGNRKGR